MRILFLLLILCCSELKAQTTYSIAKSTVAIDSLGNKYPSKSWPQLYEQGYGFKPESPTDPNTRFVVFKLSTEQLRRRDSVRQLKLAPLKKGDPVRAFATTDMNGNSVAITDTTSGVVVLNFWFINCAPCRREIPGLNEITEEYRLNDEVRFYAIALDKKKELIPFLQYSKFAYTIIPDGQSIAFKYGIEGYPTSMVIKNGKVVYTDMGVGLNPLKKAIKQALK